MCEMNAWCVEYGRARDFYALQVMRLPQIRNLNVSNKKNYEPPIITKLLFEREDIIVSRQGVARVLKVYKETGTIDRRRGVTVRLQWRASCQQISTPRMKTCPMWINASTRMRVFNAVTAIC